MRAGHDAGPVAENHPVSEFYPFLRDFRNGAYTTLFVEDAFPVVMSGRVDHPSSVGTTVSLARDTHFWSVLERMVTLAPWHSGDFCRHSRAG